MTAPGYARDPCAVELTLLGIEFLLRMFLNLFVNPSLTNPFSSSGILPLGLHMKNAFHLLAVSIGMIFVA
jgi:hypothetical protein